MNKLRNNYPKVKIQFINPDILLNLEHLIYAVKQSYFAKKRNLLGAKTIEMDVLLRLSATDQIKEAIKYSGISSKNKSFIILAMGKIQLLKELNYWISENLNPLYDFQINNNNLLTNKKINLQKQNRALELLSYSTAIIAIRSTNLIDS